MPAKPKALVRYPLNLHHSGNYVKGVGFVPKKAAGIVFKEPANRHSTDGLSLPFVGYGKGKGKVILMVASHGKFSDSEADDSDDEATRPHSKL